MTRGFYRNFQVTGVARPDQLVEALRRYPKRIEYVPKILYKIFVLTMHFETPRPDVIKVSNKNACSQKLNIFC